MAKNVKKTVVVKQTGKKAPKPAAPEAIGTGFKKDFTPAEKKDITTKRHEMRARLYAVG